MRRSTALVIAVAFLASSCTREDQVSYASLTVSPVVVEAATKAVTADDMTVFIDGEDFHVQYAFADLPGQIAVPVDKDIPYVVSAENISVEDAEIRPDIWGQKRYAGSTEVLVDRFMKKDEEGNNVPLTYSVTVNCIVANSMLSVVFDESVLAYYSEPKVTAYTDQGRKLEFTPENALAALAHFTSGQQLFFEFTGLFNVSGEQKFHMDCIDLDPAMHYILTFKMEFTEGSLQQPVIMVDEHCEDIYETMTVDPSDDGVFDKQTE